MANPLAADEQLDPVLHDRVIAGGLAAAAQAGVRGAVKVRLVLRNAEPAGRIAAELAAVLP